MAADGRAAALRAVDYGATGSSNAPEWSPARPDGRFHATWAALAGVRLDGRTRAVRQLTSVGRTKIQLAPDSRHMAFGVGSSGYRQLWIIDVETARIRPLLQKSGARLPAWVSALPETASSTP